MVVIAKPFTFDDGDPRAMLRHLDQWARNSLGTPEAWGSVLERCGQWAGADVDTSADGSDIPAPPSESLPHAVTTSAAVSAATSTLRRGSAPPLGPGPERRVRVSNAISVIALVSPIRPPDLFSHS